MYVGTAVQIAGVALGAVFAGACGASFGVLLGQICIILMIGRVLNGLVNGPKTAQAEDEDVTARC
jgi:hypothetical protein